jgi:hypothetical protein
MIEEALMNDDDESDGTGTIDELMSMPHVPEGSVLLRNIAPLSVLGLKDPVKQRLGAGSFGSAYDVSLLGRSVLKLTRDPFEAIAAKLLVGKVFKNIVPIYGVWAVPLTTAEGLATWSVIHKGYLSPLSPREKKLVNILFEIYFDDMLALAVPKPGQHRVRNQWLDPIRDAFEEEGVPRAEVPHAMAILDKIASGVRELASVGLDWKDFHAGNIMKDERGVFRIADIGCGMTYDDVAPEIAYLSEQAARSHLTGLS